MNEIALSDTYRLFYPDLGSAIAIDSEITEDTRDLVISKIERQEQRSGPIVLAINSRGGEVHCLLSILETLQNKRSELDKPILTTVGIRICKSAGAELLIAGDYAVAKPQAEILVHKGGLNPDPSVDAATVERQIKKTFEVRAMAAAEMITLRLIKRAIICRERRDELLVMFGKVGWENLVTGKPIVDFFEWHKGAGFSKLRPVVQASLRHLSEALDDAEIVKNLLVQTPDKQRDVLKQKGPDAFRQLNDLVMAMCRTFLRYSFKFKAEEAYFLGIVDEIARDAFA